VSSIKRTKALVSAAPYVSRETPANAGRIVFYASTFRSEPDHDGDVVDPLAFDAWLATLKSSGARLPILWSHKFDTPIGFAEAEGVNVDQHGLRIEAVLDLTNPDARRVYDQVRQGIVKEASFAYTILDEVRRSDGANVLKMLAVHEASLVLFGADEATSVVDVKDSDFAAELAHVKTLAVLDNLERFVTEQPQPRGREPSCAPRWCSRHKGVSGSSLPAILMVPTAVGTVARRRRSRSRSERSTPSRVCLHRPLGEMSTDRVRRKPAGRKDEIALLPGECFGTLGAGVGQATHG
jgi:uncharacterized protein